MCFGGCAGNYLLYLTLLIYGYASLVLKVVLMPKKKEIKGKPAKGEETRVVFADKKPRRKKTEKRKAVAPGKSSESFPIVGIGASAGGLEASTEFLKNLPSDTGMAFVFVQHLAPGQESLLTDILARSTPMAVHKVENDMEVKRNNIYVIPPDVKMTIINHTLKLQPQERKAASSNKRFSNIAG